MRIAAWLVAGSAACLGWRAGSVLAGDEGARGGMNLSEVSLTPTQPEGEAGGTPADTASESSLSGLSFRLRAGGVYSMEADLDAGAGKVSVGRLGGSFAITGRPDDRSSLTLQFGSEFSFYDFSDVGSLLPSGGEPIENAAKHDIGLLYSRKLDDHWSLFAGGSLEFVPATGASWDESVLGSGVVGASYQLREGLRIGLGVAVSSRLEDDARVIPVPLIDWQISDRWSLRTVDRAVDIRGVELAYQATDSVELFVLAGWASREFRLDDDAAAPDGVFRDERVPLMGGLSWGFLPEATLEVAVGADMWTNYQVLDATGAELADVDADPALTGWLGVTVRF